jgi:hypothetical protein
MSLPRSHFSSLSASARASAIEVRRSDHVEDDLPWRGDRLHDGAERLYAPADTEVERQRSAGQEPIRAATGDAEGVTQKQPTHRRRVYVRCLRRSWSFVRSRQPLLLRIIIRCRGEVNFPYCGVESLSTTA